MSKLIGRPIIIGKPSAPASKLSPDLFGRATPIFIFMFDFDCWDLGLCIDSEDELELGVRIGFACVVVVVNGDVEEVVVVVVVVGAEDLDNTCVCGRGDER